MDIEVNDKAIYSINGINGESIVSRYDKSSKQIKTLKLKDVVLYNLEINNETLYGFDLYYDKSDHIKSTLYEIDATSLKIKNTIDITQCGTEQNFACNMDDKIYFSNQYNAGSLPQTVSNQISVLNTNNYKVENIKLKAKFPFQVLKYNNKLLLTHCDIVQNTGNELTIYDPSTGTQNLIHLQNVPRQSYVYNHYLYSMDTNKLYIYDMDQNYKLIKNKIVLTKNNEKQVLYYLASFFVNE